MWILKKFVPWKPVSEVFYTSNTLSIALCSSFQIRHCYVNFTTDREGIQRGKAAWKLPLSMRDKSYTRDCTKQTSEFPQLQNIDLNLQLLFTEVCLPNQHRCGCCCCCCCWFFQSVYAFFSCALSNWQVSDICTKNVRYSVWKSVKSPFSLHKQKYFGEAII